MKLALSLILPLMAFGFEWSVQLPEAATQAVPTIKMSASDQAAMKFKDGVALNAAPGAKGEQPANLATADFDGDGIPDVAVASTDGTVRIYRGTQRSSRFDPTNAANAFAPEEAKFPLGTEPSFLLAGDFNADGHQDLVAASLQSENLFLISGDGKGGCNPPMPIAVNGRITAMASGEIGRRDGQADLAVAVENQKGAFLMVFEHPEGAFTHQPDVYKLPASASSIAIGQFDRDWYSDVAVAAGNNVIVIHGRGQVYPWDIDPELGIVRPGAVVEQRTFPFTITRVATGDFENTGKDDLALVSDTGDLSLLRPPQPRAAAKPLPNGIKTVKGGFLPSGGARPAVAFADIAAAKTSDPDAMIDTPVTHDAIEKRQQDSVKKDAELLGSLSKQEISRRSADAAALAADQRARAKAAFVMSVSARPSPLAGWSYMPLINAPKLATARLISKARVASKAGDQLVAVGGSGVQVVDFQRSPATTQKRVRTLPRATVSTFAASTETLAAIPMKVNADAIDDLLIVRNADTAPQLILSAPAQTYTVTTETDDFTNCEQAGQPCSLRSAIELANQTADPVEIDFNIPGPGVHTIHIAAELPDITNSVTMNGATQPGFNGKPLIEIKGDLINGTSADGLNIKTSNAMIANLAINSFPSVIDQNTGSEIGGNGIAIFSTSQYPNNGNNIIQNCYLGTDPTGTVAEGNKATGLLIFDSDSNFIAFNLVSGNNDETGQLGTGISVTAGDNNFFAGNLIGTDITGDHKLGNGRGILLTGANNQIGGDGQYDGNTISGNGVAYDPSVSSNQCHGEGLIIVPAFDLVTGEFLTFGNTVQGNKVGTTSDGLTALGNCSTGIATSPEEQTVVGSISHYGRNIVSDNGYDGITCESFFLDPTTSVGGFCAISGNNIGTDITGSIPMGNDWRNVLGGLVQISGVVDIINNVSLSNVGAPGGTTPRGPCTGYCNLISGNNTGNDAPGVLDRHGAGTVGIFNNFVGTNQAGNAALGNATTVFPISGDTYVGLYVTGQNLNLGNVLSGNNSSGLAFTDAFRGQGVPVANNICQANLIGTDATGSFAIPNAGGGINAVSRFGDSTTIGGIDVNQRNIISGNSGNGIDIINLGGTVGITNNAIGVVRGGGPLGNMRNGVLVQGFGTTVGADKGNIIANNGLAGVQVLGSQQPSFANPIRGNAIYDNSGLGIDLSMANTDAGDGVTPNDCFDPDQGANELQNYPVLFAPTTSGNGRVVTGYIRTEPSANITLDFYASSDADPSGYGEGKDYIGTTQIRTNANGFAGIDFRTDPVPVNDPFITATATDDLGNTSEFSCVAGQCVPAGIKDVAQAEIVLNTDNCAQPIVVNTTGDEDDADLTDQECDTDVNTPGIQCSLRAAIEQAEANAGADVITFDIPGSGPFTIVPQTPYPTIQQPITIDASTQQGYSGTPLVTIDGHLIAPHNYGLALKGGSSLVRGLAIVNFYEELGFGGGSTSNDNRAQANWLGMDASGQLGDPNLQKYGIALTNATQRNLIGGAHDVDGNVISGLGSAGISIIRGSNNNVIQGNYVGTDPSGTLGGPNNIGIDIQDSNNNVIGSSDPAKLNVISGNTTDGVLIELTSEQNKLVGNYIGVDKTGLHSLPNAKGVHIISSATQNVVGGTTQAERNVISGNDVDQNSCGVLIGPDAGATNQVQGNIVGYSADGQAYVPNHIGIAVNADSQTIGSSDPSAYHNRIVGDTTDFGYGIYLHPFSPNDELDNVVVENNDIGTLPAAQGDGGAVGIFLYDNVKSATVTGNVVGQQVETGIRLEAGPHNNTVVNNIVGIDGGNNQIPNGRGIAIRQADTNFIKNNVVSGNVLFQIGMGDGYTTVTNAAPEKRRQDKLLPSTPVAALTTNNIVIGNKVGTNVDGDSSIGTGELGIVVATNARNNTIGGPSSGQGNTVGGQTGTLGFGILVGVLVPDDLSSSLLPQNNSVIGNFVGVNSGGSYIANNYGIYVRNAVGTTVGGASQGTGNIVGNSIVDGIRVFKPETVDTSIVGNYVGVRPDGTGISNQRHGISVEQVQPGPTAIDNNVIADNGIDGIFAANIQTAPPSVTSRIRAKSPADSPTLELSANLIGAVQQLDGSFTTYAQEQHGVELECVQAALIQLGNVLAAQHDAALKITGDTGTQGPVRAPTAQCPSGGNTITGNFIGSNSVGATGLGNQGDGIAIHNSSGDTIGTPSAGNTVVSNQGNGVYVDSVTGERLNANNIGVLRGGGGDFTPMGNQKNGVDVAGTSDVDIGVANDINSANVIAANQQAGILIEQFTNQLRVRNNVIGDVIKNLHVASRSVSSVSFGNGGDGILITSGSYANQVGAASIGSGNTIVNNGGAGVRIDETAGTGNLVDPNVIYDNAGPGIDLGSTGTTPNDPADGDSGPNNLQNYPEFLSANVNGSGHLIVTYKVDSDPANSDYGSNGLYIEFFKADGSVILQGQTFLGNAYYTAADHAAPGMKATIDLGDTGTLGVNFGDKLLATATDASGNTSEFTGSNIGVVMNPTAARVLVSGQS